MMCSAFFTEERKERRRGAIRGLLPTRVMKVVGFVFLGYLLLIAMLVLLTLSPPSARI